MRIQACVSLVACGILTLVSQIHSATGPVEEPVKSPTLSDVEKLMFEGTNAFRKREGQAELKTDKKLAETARKFAEFMAKNDEYGHNADGHDPGERAKESGYEFCALSENIAYQLSSAGFTTKDLASKFVEAWKESPGHRKNMLDADVTEAGMGVAHSEKSDKYYAVQMFGRPKSAMIEFEVVNTTEEDTSYELDGEKYELPARVTRTHGLCRQGNLVFSWLKKDDKPEQFRPAQGDRFEVSKAGDKFELKHKTAEKPKAASHRVAPPG